VADALFVRLGDRGTDAAWATFAPTGQLTSAIERGPLADVRTAAEGRRVVVRAPGVDVITIQAQLPAGSQGRMRQVVPFLLEDFLADDVEKLMFAIGGRLESGAAAVTVVARARLEAWLAELAAVGIVPHAMYNETEGVPDVPGTLMMLIEGARIFARKPGQSPLALEGLELAQALALVRGGAPADEVSNVVAYVDPDARTRFEDGLAGLADQFSSAEVKLAADGMFAHLAATLAQRPGTNLLQGAYSPKSNWVELSRPWRLAAGLLVSFGVLGLVLQGAQYWSLRRADEGLEKLVLESCQRLVGANRMSACEAELLKRTRQQSSGTSETFLSTLDAIAGARKPEIRVDALSYRNKIMDLQLVVATVDELDAFARSLEQTHRFTPKIESTSKNEDKVEGRLQIVGARP